jgi:endonuclease-3
LTHTDWDTFFSILEAWRIRILSDETDDASVTAIARTSGRDPWAVLVSTILSLRTKDAVTLATSVRLLEKAPTPQAILALDEEETARLAYPSGFYRTKAKNLRAIAAILLERYGGKVPADQEALLALPGVGLKSANLILSEAFDLDAICVDIHVHRIANRRGWLRTDSPDASEALLRGILPRVYWKRINNLLVMYGQRICTPVSPRCSLCVLQEGCARVGVEKSR